MGHFFKTQPNPKLLDPTQPTKVSTRPNPTHHRYLVWHIRLYRKLYTTTVTRHRQVHSQWQLLFSCSSNCAVGVSRTFSWIWLLLYMNTQAPASVTVESYRQNFWPRPGSDKAACWLRPFSASRSTGSWITWMPILALGWARHPLPISCMLTIPPYSRHHSSRQ